MTWIYKSFEVCTIATAIDDRNHGIGLRAWLTVGEITDRHLAKYIIICVECLIEDTECALATRLDGYIGNRLWFVIDTHDIDALVAKEQFTIHRNVLDANIPPRLATACLTIYGKETSTLSVRINIRIILIPFVVTQSDVSTTFGIGHSQGTIVLDVSHINVRNVADRTVVMPCADHSTITRRLHIEEGPEGHTAETAVINGHAL